jgi:hypothetical protein
MLTLNIIVYGLIKDINNMENYMANDLRSRVVAVRLLNNGTDPYFYKWKASEDIIFLDPRDFPNRPVSRVTVPPTILVIHNSLLKFSYIVQKYIWLIIQWISLIVSIYIFTLGIGNKQYRIMLMVSILVFFSSTWFWRFHVDAGQLYIIYILIFSISYYVLRKSENFDSTLSGIILGCLIAMRFNTIVFCIPLIILRKVKTILGIIFGYFINILCSISLWGLEPWINYFKAIRIHGLIHLGLLKIDNITNSAYFNIKEVENVKKFDILPRFLYSDSSLQGLLNLSTIKLAIFLTFVIFIYIFILFLKRKNINTVEIIFLSGITAVIISEFFIPATRYAYYDVIWLIPLCLLIKSTKQYKMRYFDLIIIIMGILVLSLAENYYVLSIIGPFISLIGTIHSIIVEIKN